MRNVSKIQPHNYKELLWGKILNKKTKVLWKELLLRSEDVGGRI